VPKLLSLSVCDNQLAQLSGLQSLSNLQTLLLNVNQIKSMRGLEMCANLKTLELANNQVRARTNQMLQLASSKYYQLLFVRLKMWKAWIRAHNCKRFPCIATTFENCRTV
jgi:hypothetical protein